MKIAVNFFNRLMSRYMPDPFLLVILLTVVVFVLGWTLTPSTPVQLVEYWGQGFWQLLSFSMQMVLVLVTGYILASSPLFKRLLQSVAKLAKTPGAAIVLVTLVSLVASWINWGFGLVIGALFAKELARVVKNVDYRLLVASGYGGFIIWHAGFSSSTALQIATPESLTGFVIPTSETIFAPFNLIIIGALVVALPILNRLMMPSKDHTVTIDPALLVDEQAAAVEGEVEKTPAYRLENSWIVSVVISMLGIIYLVVYFYDRGFQLDLNVVNFIFLTLGILLHGTPRRFLNALLQAVKGAGGIIIQFPFYAGIMGILQSSGLALLIAQWFTSFSTSETFAMFTFWSAGVLNIVIPSGGGQWAVQAPVVVEAAQMLGASMPKAAMAVAWGDAWTNLIQPFWALPALGVAGLKAKDIMGFCVIALVLSGIIISLGFLLL